MAPQARYARSGDVNIAYTVVGDGPFDLVYIQGFVSHVELAWRVPAYADFLRGAGADVAHCEHYQAARAAIATARPADETR